MLLTHANMMLFNEMYRDKGSRPELFLEKIVLKNPRKLPGGYPPLNATLWWAIAANQNN